MMSLLGVVLFSNRNLSPKCSLSMGKISLVFKNLPPTTRLSLFASASFLPSACIFRLGARPAKPTRAFITFFELEISSISSSPASPKKMFLASMFFTFLASFSSPTQTNFGLNFKICSFSKATFLAQLSASTSTLNFSQRLRAFLPIEPVEPSITTIATKVAQQRQINSHLSYQAYRRVLEIASHCL